MNYYETLFIVHPALEAGRLKDIILSIDENLKKDDGKTLSIDVWGKKRLAYLIEKQKYGTFVKFQFSGKGNCAKKIEMELAKIRVRKNINPKGNFSSMKGKLSWPASGNIISKFGNQRNPDTKTITFNQYIEIQSQLNSSVSSVLDGMVSKISFMPSYGSFVIVDHGGGYRTVYSNLDNIIVNENDYIQSGQKIARVSDNNNKLQFQVWYNDEPFNPEQWLRRK